SFSLGSMTFFPGFILMRQKKLTAYFSFLFTFPSIIASVLLLPFVDQVNIIFFHGIHISDQTVGIAVAALLLCLLIPVLSGNPVINVFCRIAFIRVERIAVTGQDLIDGQLRAGMHHFHTGVHHAVQFRLGQQPLAAVRKHKIRNGSLQAVFHRHVFHCRSLGGNRRGRRGLSGNRRGRRSLSGSRSSRRICSHFRRSLSLFFLL